jgi:hypothetical protein
MLPSNLELPRSASAKPIAQISIEKAPAVLSSHVLAKNASDVAQQQELPLALVHHNSSSHLKSRPSRLNLKRRSPRIAARTKHNSARASVNIAPSSTLEPNKPPCTPPHQVLDHKDLRTPPGAPKTAEDELEPWRMKQKKRSAPSEDAGSVSQVPKRRKVRETMKSAGRSVAREGEL